MAHSFPASQDGFKGGFQQEASVGLSIPAPAHGPASAPAGAPEATRRDRDPAQRRHALRWAGTAGPASPAGVRASPARTSHLTGKDLAPHLAGTSRPLWSKGHLLEGIAANFALVVVDRRHRDAALSTTTSAQSRSRRRMGCPFDQNEREVRSSGDASRQTRPPGSERGPGGRCPERIAGSGPHALSATCPRDRLALGGRRVSAVARSRTRGTASQGPGFEAWRAGCTRLERDLAR